MARRASLVLAPFAPLLLTAVVATCDDPTYTCAPGDGEALFEDRIVPLLDADRLQSCNQCHLSGVDLSLWLQDDACSTMACMIEDGMVDLEAPADSALLRFIDRAQPESKGITGDVIAEEREAVEAWIQRAASCRDCLPPVDGTSACGRPRPGPCRAYDPRFADPGGCDDKTLEQLFMNTFFFDRGRCYPCHFEQGHAELEAPAFIFEGPCSAASLKSLRELVRRGYLDPDDPDQSLWIQKPLDEELGGLPHGGDAKYHALDEPSYLDAVHFTRRWAACQR